MIRAFSLLLSVFFLAQGCARPNLRPITATAYCGCGECNGYTRGHWICLKLDFWNKTIATGPQTGEPYTGLTASGDRLCVYHPGLISADSLIRPWLIPWRIIFPWLWLEQDGTLAADTRYYPFGTRMFVPGYGWGQVEDRGRAIKGPDRIDLFMRRHGATENWGRRQVDVEIYKTE